jgi:predicted Fe-Mo cluster-binding NifX family protein
MKIILTTITPDIDSELDPRFGRGAYFLIVDSETQEWQSLPNPASNASGGAGVRAAQFVTEQNCDTIISGDFGPNAFEALTEAGITMYLFGSCRTVKEALGRLESGQLEQLNSPSLSSQAKH